MAKSDAKVLIEYLTSEQLREVRQSWYDSGYDDTEPRVAVLSQAINLLGDEED